MKKCRFTDSQILAILRQADAGTPAPALCREQGISSATFYKWRAKYGGMDASLMKRVKELQDEKRRLKKMYGGESVSGWPVRPSWSARPAIATSRSCQTRTPGLPTGRSG